ncbi:hypothetical protein ACFL6H_04880 [Candidatus Latescibacterota bacterium]
MRAFLSNVKSVKDIFIKWCKKYLNRIFFAIIYFLGPIIIVFIYRNEIFYISVSCNPYNLYRLLWCICSSFFGFSIVAIKLRIAGKDAEDNAKTKAFPTYLIYYPFILLMMASLVFSILHIFNKTSGFIFYSMSFSLCFILSFLVDDFFRLIINTMNIVANTVKKLT